MVCACTEGAAMILIPAPKRTTTINGRLFFIALLSSPVSKFAEEEVVIKLVHVAVVSDICFFFAACRTVCCGSEVTVAACQDVVVKNIDLIVIIDITVDHRSQR